MTFKALLPGRLVLMHAFAELAGAAGNGYIQDDATCSSDSNCNVVQWDYTGRHRPLHRPKHCSDNCTAQKMTQQG